MGTRDWQVCQWEWAIPMATLQPTGLCLLLPLYPIGPSSEGRVEGCVSFAAEAEAADEALRLAQDGADAGGRDNFRS